jgi:hypothetical protein
MGLRGCRHCDVIDLKYDSCTKRPALAQHKTILAVDRRDKCVLKSTRADRPFAHHATNLFLSCWIAKYQSRWGGVVVTNDRETPTQPEWRELW